MANKNPDPKLIEAVAAAHLPWRAAAKNEGVTFATFAVAIAEACEGGWSLAQVGDLAAAQGCCAKVDDNGKAVPYSKVTMNTWYACGVILAKDASKVSWVTSADLRSFITNIQKDGVSITDIKKVAKDAATHEAATAAVEALKPKDTSNATEGDAKATGTKGANNDAPAVKVQKRCDDALKKAKALRKAKALGKGHLPTLKAIVAEYVAMVAALEA